MPSGRFTDKINSMVDKHEGLTDPPRNPHGGKWDKALREFGRSLCIAYEDRGDDGLQAVLRERLELLLEEAAYAAEFIRNNEVYTKFKKELSKWKS